MKPPEPPALTLTKAESDAMVRALQVYFRDELEQDLGALAAQMLLDMLRKRLGPYFYNRGLYDAQAAFAARMEDVSDVIFALEKRPG